MSSPTPVINDEKLLVKRNGDKFEYYAHPDLIVAANTALALDMPLLLTGEPGCGKTEFAYALANAVADNNIKEAYVRSDTTAKDLLYSYDSLRRFGESQFGSGDEKARSRDPRNYITLEALGRGLCSRDPSVILIDEIDKAQRDLPNDLLLELDRGEFEIRELSGIEPTEDAVDIDRCETFRPRMQRVKGAKQPAIVITSNVERQLPDPFLRRCIFFYIPPPDAAQLERILKSRFPETPPFIKQSLVIFLELRKVPGLVKKPATSELINWVDGLNRNTDPTRADNLPLIENTINKGDRVNWHDLPGLCCLIKLREDLERLGVELA